jgi:mycothiol system anti-sigma-R factor
MEQLYEYIDEELDDEGTVEKIREHLELCKRCYPRYDFEKAFLRFLAEQGQISAPPELRRKIFQEILEEES